MKSLIGDLSTHASVIRSPRFLTLFDTLDQPFDEDASPIHVTGSAIVTGERGVVLHLHKRLGIWLQPGGHIDSGETPWQAALHETREETGLPVKPATDADVSQPISCMSTSTPGHAATRISICATTSLRRPSSRRLPRARAPRPDGSPGGRRSTCASPAWRGSCACCNPAGR